MHLFEIDKVLTIKMSLKETHETKEEEKTIQIFFEAKSPPQLCIVFIVAEDVVSSSGNSSMPLP